MSVEPGDTAPFAEEGQECSEMVKAVAATIATTHKTVTTFPEACDVEFVIGREGDVQNFFAVGFIMASISPVFRYPDISSVFFVLCGLSEPICKGKCYTAR